MRVGSLADLVGKGNQILIMEAEEYTGKVVSRPRYDKRGKETKQFEYYFCTDDGELIPIGKRNLSVDEKGLILRLRPMSYQEAVQ